MAAGGRGQPGPAGRRRRRGGGLPDRARHVPAGGRHRIRGGGQSYAGAPRTARRSGPNLLAWPPFGPDVHIVMPGWLPRASDGGQAVIVAKDFLLAFLYAEYRGNQDDRWSGYVSGYGA